MCYMWHSPCFKALPSLQDVYYSPETCSTAEVQNNQPSVILQTSLGPAKPKISSSAPEKEPLAPHMGLSAKLASSWALSKLCPPSTTLLITAKRKQQSSVQRQFLPSLFLWGLLPLQMCAQVSLVSLISVNNYC